MGAHLFKKALPHLVAILTFFVVSAIYFSPQFQGKKIRQGDIEQGKGMIKEMNDYKAQTGESALWTNAMFGGMPTYQIASPQRGNLVRRFIEPLMQLKISAPLSWFFVSFLSFYIMLIALGVSPWVAIVGALAFGFTTNNFVLYEAGHTSKFRAISYAPLVVAGVILAYKEKLILGGVVFLLGMALNVATNHPQMTYYLGIGLGFYVLAQLITAVKSGNIKSFAMGSAVLTLCSVLALGTSASKLMTSYEYGEDTMRGAAILKTEASNTTASSSSETDGLAFEYAMQWSNGWLDLLSIVIPRAVGGGSAEKLSSSSNLYKDLRSKGANLGNDFRAPLYWGALPFTSGPNYFGALISFFFIMGFWLIDGRIKWSLAAAILLTMLLSLGKNFSLLNEPIFNYFPLYSKFRAPSSILGITNVFYCLMGALALNKIFSATISKEKVLNALKFSAIGMGVFLLFFAFIGPSIFDFSSPGDARLASSGYDINAVVNDRKEALRNDALRSLLIIALGVGLVWAYIQQKINKTIVLAALGVIMIGDLWTVGRRYIDNSSFQKARTANERPFPFRAADQQIYASEGVDFSAEGSSNNSSLKRRGHYRVFDMAVNTFNSSSTSYYHNTIGGYHPAKLQRIQDLIDQYIGQGNQNVLGMLNTKYYITREQQVQQNPNALGPAWFVESIQKANNPNEEITALGTIDPANQAIVLDSEFGNYIGNFDPQKNGTISLTDYYPTHLTYQTNSTSEQLAVFSEVWYGPNKGWQAYIDGTAVDHVRANYILRALKVPAGQHKIEFKFAPASFQTGEMISYASSILLLLLVFGYLGKEFMTYYKGIPEEMALEASKVKSRAASKTKPTLKKTTKRKKK